MARAVFDLRDPRQLLALGFGSGLLPRWPGTAGTAVAVPLALLVGQLPILAQIAVILAGFLLGCRICWTAARAAGVHDHPAIVWDEIIGFLVACLGVPLSAPALVVAFVVFRAIDVRKPRPIRWVDRHVGGGFGIMLDDVLAGALTAALLHLLVAMQLL